MTDDELIDYILNNNHLSISPILKSWFKECNHFKNFVDRYKDKIRKRIRKVKNEEALSKVIAELFVAYCLLSDSRFTIEYEPFSSEEGTSPDFKVFFNGKEKIEFIVEVTRISRAESDAQFDELCHEIIKQIKIGPGNLEFSLKLTPFYSQSLYKRLSKSKERIIQFIEDTIYTEAGQLPVKKEVQYSLPNFEKELYLVLFKHSFEPESNETAFNFFRPIPYTQKELYKIGDILIEEKLKQLRPGMVNILVIISDSNTLEFKDLHQEMNLLYCLPYQDDEVLIGKILKNFSSVDEFYEKMKNLSGILLRINPYEGAAVLWCNQYADKQIPDIIQEHLRQIGKIKILKQSL